MSVEKPTGQDAAAWRRAIWVANLSSGPGEAWDRCLGRFRCGDGFLSVRDTMCRVERITGWRLGLHLEPSTPTQTEVVDAFVLVGEEASVRDVVDQQGDRIALIEAHPKFRRKPD